MLGELDPPLPPPRHLVQADLPLEDLRDDHVACVVHIVAVPGGHAVPAGEVELLIKYYKLYHYILYNIKNIIINYT